MDTERAEVVTFLKVMLFFYKEINCRFNSSGLGFQSKGARATSVSVLEILPEEVSTGFDGQ